MFKKYLNVYELKNKIGMLLISSFLSILTFNEMLRKKIPSFCKNSKEFFYFIVELSNIFTKLLANFLTTNCCLVYCKK